MNKRDSLFHIWLASFLGNCFGVAAVVGYILFSLAGELGSSFGDFLLLAIFAWLYGLVLAQLSVVPLGTLIGWILTFQKAANWRRAAAGGTLTGAIAGFAVTARTLLGNAPPEAVPEARTTLFVVAAIGGLSGLVGYRAVFYRPRRSENAD